MGKGQAIYGRLHRCTVYGCCADIRLVEGRGFNSLQMGAFDMKIKKIKKIKKILKKYLSKYFICCIMQLLLRNNGLSPKGKALDSDSSI